MPLNITVPHSDSDSGGDDYEIVGSPSSRPSSWETNVEEYYGDGYFAPRHAAELEREEAELKERIREIRRASPAGGHFPKSPRIRGRHENRPRAHDGRMGSPDPEDFEGHGHRIQTLPLSPPPPGLRSAPGLPHRSELAMGRHPPPPPPPALRRPSYERRGSENLDEDEWFGPPSPGIEEFSGNARGPNYSPHVYSTGGRPPPHPIIEYVPSGRMSPRYSPVPVEIEAGRRRYHPTRILRDEEHPSRSSYPADPSLHEHRKIPPPMVPASASSRIKPINTYAKEREGTNQRSLTHRGSSPHRQPEPYYSEHSHIHDTRPELGRGDPSSPRLDKTPDGGRIHSQVRYLGANSAFVGDIPRAPPEAYGHSDLHPTSPPRRTEPLYSTSQGYRVSAPLPTPIKLRDPAGRVYSFPFNQCKKWADFQKLVRDACGYLDDIGPAVRAGEYYVLDPRGSEVRKEEWKDMVRPGWGLSLVVNGYEF